MGQTNVDSEGTEYTVNDQGEALVSDSRDENSATEQAAAPRAPEEVKPKVEAKPENTIDYEKSYKELERTYQKSQQELSRYKKDFDPISKYKEQVSEWAKADEVLKQDPVANRYLQARLQGFSHTDAQSYAEQAQTNPHLEHLVKEVNTLKSTHQEWKQAQETARVNSHLDAQEAAANKIAKQYLGREMDKAERDEFYGFMADNNLFNGEIAAKALFAEKYSSAAVQKALQEQKTKGQTLVQKTSTVKGADSSKAEEGNMSFREAFKSSMSELRHEN